MIGLCFIVSDWEWIYFNINRKGEGRVGLVVDVMRWTERVNSCQNYKWTFLRYVWPDLRSRSRWRTLKRYFHDRDQTKPKPPPPPGYPWWSRDYTDYRPHHWKSRTNFLHWRSFFLPPFFLSLSFFSFFSLPFSPSERYVVTGKRRDQSQCIFVSVVHITRLIKSRIKISSVVLRWIKWFYTL